jgi:hypothetical protein
LEPRILKLGVVVIVIVVARGGHKLLL